MYYRRGMVSTTIKWNRPNINAIKNWYKSMKPVIDSTDFICNIVGSTLYDIDNAKDLDIVYTGNVNNINMLEHILNCSIDMGFRTNMLVDCKWASSTTTVIDKKPADVDFIFLDYYEQDDGKGVRMIHDYTKNPQYQRVGNNTVRSNFKQLNSPLKSHQLKYLETYNILPSMPIEDFIKE